MSSPRDRAEVSAFDYHTLEGPIAVDDSQVCTFTLSQLSFQGLCY